MVYKIPSVHKTLMDCKFHIMCEVMLLLSTAQEKRPINTYPNGTCIYTVLTR